MPQPPTNEVMQAYQRHISTFMHALPLWHEGGQEVGVQHVKDLPAAIGSVVMLADSWRESRAWNFSPAEYADDPQPHLVLGTVEQGCDVHSEIGVLLVHLEATRTPLLRVEHCIVPFSEWQALRLLQQATCAQASNDVPHLAGSYYEPSSLRIRRPESAMQYYSAHQVVRQVADGGLHSRLGLAIEGVTPDIGHFFRIPKHILRLAHAFDRVNDGMVARNALIALQNRYHDPARTFSL